MFFSAAARSESSGMLLHRKNDRRDASSGSVMRYGVLGAALSGWPSNRNRKFGLTRMLRSASSSPESNASGPPFFDASLYRAIGIRRSASITGRRYARRASAAMIFLAQASSAGDAGWQTNSRRRLGESCVAAAVDAFGPLIVTFEMPGSPLPARYGSRRKYGSNRSSSDADVLWTKYTCTR